MTDGRQREWYARDVECAIGLNVGTGGTEGVRAARDAVLAIRDAELERLQTAEGVIARVRALHREECGCCAECTSSHSVLWPCPTITAITDLRGD